MSGENWRDWSTFGLAYLGDALFEVWCREQVLRHSQQAKQVHERVVHLVRCQTQSRLSEIWEEHLSEAERDVFRRGRNHPTGSTPRHASIRDYRNATGLESLIGYWHLQGSSRFEELMQLSAARLLVASILQDNHT